MTTSFNALKKSRTTQFENLNSKLEELNKKSFKDDDATFWRHTADKTGNAYALLRFLPAPPGEDSPFIRYWDHGFKGASGRWYIEKSRSTLGEPDPVGEHNQQLWATGIKENQDIVRARKRNLRFVSNIYVVKDSGNPENEGKVFKYRYGKKIFDKLNAKMHPEFEDEKAINPFDLWDGCNLRLKVRKVEGFTNYDKSDFDEPGPLFADESKMEEIWKSEHPLAPIIAPSEFKSYEELKRQFYSVIGESPEKQEAGEDREPATEAKASRRTKEAVSEDDDDGTNFFEKLSKED